MALNSFVPSAVTLRDVADSSDLRLDPHHHLLSPLVRSLRHGIARGVRVSTPYFPRLANGLNLPQGAYDLEGEVEGGESAYLYASVGALSLYALQSERCTPLRDPEVFTYDEDLATAAARPTEVLVTRSGTPGIAWPCAALAENEPAVIPSGFVIRIECDPEVMLPTYLAAVLNHPLWRVWSSSLASGKRQRNLSQEHLAQIKVPLARLDLQRRVAEGYLAALDSISGVLTTKVKIQNICDAILSRVLPAPAPSFVLPAFSLDLVKLSYCGASDVLRLDARFHNAAVQGMARFLDEVACVTLSSLLVGDIIKNGQPEILRMDDDSVTSRVIATSSIQGGAVVSHLTKPASEETVEEAGERRVRPNDVLVTLDGEGSIGKAAAVPTDLAAVTDSHIGILRLKRPEWAGALACFINSSLGQAQFFLHTSGATGQTQVSKYDVLRFRVPVAVLDHAAQVGTAYAGELVKFERVPDTVGRMMAKQAVTTTACLLESDALLPEAVAALEETAEQHQLTRTLALVDAKAFW